MRDNTQREFQRRDILKKVAGTAGIAGVGFSVTAGTAAADSQSRLDIRGINNTTRYRVVVSDNNGSRGGNTEPNDNVDKPGDITRFEGEVGDGGTDTYYYTGEIRNAYADGAIAIDPDGGFNNPDSVENVRVSGSGNYTMRAHDGMNHTSRNESNDNFFDNGHGVRGEVRGGDDEYRVYGDITFIKYENVGNSVRIQRL